jgi:hypothetical protein
MNKLIAQNLPHKQKVSLWTPAPIKIDGNFAEWGTRPFQAFNRATEVYYSIVNDEKYFFMLIQAREAHIVNKIYAGGLTITFKPVNKKFKGNEIDITYPVVEKEKRFHINYANKPPADPELKVFADKANNDFHNRAKEIKVNGLTGTDTLISIYNNNGIMVQGAFNKDIYYTCELRIPLDALKNVINENGEVAYGVLLHGLNMKDNDNNTRGKATLPSGKVIPSIVHHNFNGSTSDYLSMLGSLSSDTNFQSIYKLAKK